MTSKEKKEFTVFGAQTAAVVVAALREVGAFSYVSSVFREAVVTKTTSEFEGKFLESLNDAFRLNMEGVRTQQEMSSHLHKVVIQIKDRIGAILSQKEGGDSEIRELDSLIVTEKILSHASAKLFEHISEAVRHIMEAIQARVEGTQEELVDKKNLH